MNINKKKQQQGKATKKAHKSYQNLFEEEK